ncbi:MAG: DEAD/DEAH box helicase [Eubacteriales bacterium]|nr:DEAD/DEAH box helicase [Eubacteriales bacterium]
MSEMKFTELGLLPEMQRAIDELGFETATDIQAEAIPAVREGRDVIGKSQTGTGKTLAFAIPAIEKIDRDEAETSVQVLILCPTRELAQQGADEIKKLTRFMQGIWVTDVYGGAPMDRQIAHLKKCNLVIGTPGRVMDHMRRGTLSLANVKLVVLDEADEMLSMGFREDIETILKDVPEERQTVLFSATMPDPILELTETYLTEPHMIEINREQVTLENIRQIYVDVPMGRKLDALNLLLRAYEPRLCMIFCNTKAMVEEVTQYLVRNGFAAEALHGDLNQSQRTRVMDAFKSARIPLLVATDVAARGIDVNDIDYVINYDVPGHDEYYVHRIGRTGRAGKEGTAITICSGRRQFYMIRDLARVAKSEIKQVPLPTVKEIREKQQNKQRETLLATITEGVAQNYQDMVSEMLEAGCDLQMIAAAALQTAFQKDELSLEDIVFERRSASGGMYRKLIISVGRRQKIAPNHVVSAVCERTDLSGKEIGKIEIYDDKTIVGVPADRAEQVVHALKGLKINGAPATVRLSAEKPSASPRPGMRRNPRSVAPRQDFVPQRAPADADASDAPQPVRRGKVRLSESAKARLLDGSDLSRFEIHKPRETGLKSASDFHGRKGESRRKSERHGERHGGRDGRGNRKNNDRGSVRRGKR